ncbi:centromere protein P-like [Neopsephotus bourkii]|uniref:centromere protein P-like n=1 Tax=Neopsephotus bourkii TaxID=309878 RepID=UPI002AA52B0A|nr:centromere protein P-like [Neopsephotus bourkii]
MLRKHRLSGNCCSSFQLESQLFDMQNKGNVSAAITDLSIIMEPRGNSDLDKFVSRKGVFKSTRVKNLAFSCNFQAHHALEENRGMLEYLSKIFLKEAKFSKLFSTSSEKCGSLLTFFRSLSSYAEWYEHCSCTFLHFKKLCSDL